MRNKISFTLLLSFFFFYSSLHALDLLTEYRLNGIQNIQKKMDQELAKKEYWGKYLKNIDTRFGYIEKYNNILTCDKSQSTLSLYTKDATQNYKLQNKYNAYTGKIKGDKLHEGDLKTPIGIYNITKKISKLDSFYGPMAFVTSYPNTYDKYKGKDGSGIWIHGLPTEQTRDEFTKGCIAINNENIQCLDRYIDTEKTILIINKEKIQENISKDTLADLLAALYKWRYAWIYNDIETYLSFYTPQFIRFDGMDIEKFTRYKTRIFNKGEQKEIVFKNINIIPYPNHKDLYKISFNEQYRSTSFSFNGDKVLIVKYMHNTMNIVTEK
jgi:murein L,D-transpeptidase YafK